MRLVASLMESLPAAIAAGRFGRVILQAQMSVNKMNLSHAGRLWQSDAASTGVAEQGKLVCCRNGWQVQPGEFGRVMLQTHLLLSKLNLSARFGNFNHRKVWQTDVASTGVAEQSKLVSGKFNQEGLTDGAC